MPYNPYSTTSGNDPRGRVQNQIGYQQNRYESQQGPLINSMAYNYGRGSESDMGNYQNIMNQYMNIAGGNGGDGGGGGGGGGFNAAGMYTPFTVSYSDPFESYGGFREFSQTGGYSPADIANMRARGVGGVRSAYANAQSELARNRSLQGGYSPNMAASLVKMARERGQATADATQNVEAGLASERQKGRLAGLTGMSGIEGQRLDAQLKAGMYNADAQARAQAQNIGAAESAAGRASASAAQSTADRLRALQGATSLYGTTPGQAQLFGNQALNALNSGANFGIGMINATNQAGNQTGAYDQTMNRIQQGVNMGSQVAYPFLDYFQNRNKTGKTTSSGQKDSSGRYIGE